MNPSATVVRGVFNYQSTLMQIIGIERFLSASSRSQKLIVSNDPPFTKLGELNVDALEMGCRWKWDALNFV